MRSSGRQTLANTAIEEHKDEGGYTVGIQSVQVIPTAGFLHMYCKDKPARPRALLLWHQDGEEKNLHTCQRRFSVTQVIYRISLSGELKEKASGDAICPEPFNKCACL